MITADLLSSKLKELENEVKSEIKKEIEKVNKQVSDLKGRVKSVEKTVEDLQNKVSDMETSMDKLQRENGEMAKANKQMKEQLEEREIKILVQSDEINNLEQYTRTNSVRIYGINDTDKKETPAVSANLVVKLLNGKQNLGISTADIDIAHRMGRFSTDGNIPIICKFVSRITTHDVIRTRRAHKGSAIVIREDLTLQNAKLLEKVSAKDSVTSAWSDGGKIIALLKDKSKVVIDGKTDLDSLERESVGEIE